MSTYCTCCKTCVDINCHGQTNIQAFIVDKMTILPRKYKYVGISSNEQCLNKE